MVPWTAATIAAGNMMAARQPAANFESGANEEVPPPAKAEVQNRTSIAVHSVPYRASVTAQNAPHSVNCESIRNRNQFFQRKSVYGVDEDSLMAAIRRVPPTSNMRDPAENKITGWSVS